MAKMVEGLVIENPALKEQVKRMFENLKLKT